MGSIHPVWDSICKELTEKSTGGQKKMVDQFLPKVEFGRFTNDSLILGASDPVQLDWIKDCLQVPIKEALKNEGFKDHSVIFELKESKPIETGPLLGPDVKTTKLVMESVARPKSSKFNKDYRFDSFVVGKSNELAYAAAEAICEEPGGDYNPMFIYGESGLGKTHLMHAIANRIQQTKPELQVLYVTSESFTNDFISLVRQKRMRDFRDRFRYVDVLMVDDVQFFSGKDRSLEEFFHTFNHLHDAGKQIVLSADCLPNSLKEFSERMRTRFSWGMVADIQPPEIETKAAILIAKADRLGFELTSEIAYFIASKLRSSVRDIEGAIKRVVAYHTMLKKPLSIETVQEALKGALDVHTNATPEKILKAVASNYRIPIDTLFHNSRRKDILLPRQIAMYLLHDILQHSLPQIGKRFGKDHTTALNSIKKVRSKLMQDAVFAREIEVIRSII